jgi:hypothetical protein
MLAAHAVCCVCVCVTEREKISFASVDVAERANKRKRASKKRENWQDILKIGKLDCCSARSASFLLLHPIDLYLRGLFLRRENTQIN